MWGFSFCFFLDRLRYNWCLFLNRFRYYRCLFLLFLNNWLFLNLCWSNFLRCFNNWNFLFRWRYCLFNSLFFYFWWFCNWASWLLNFFLDRSCLLLLFLNWSSIYLWWVSIDLFHWLFFLFCLFFNNWSTLFLFWFLNWSSYFSNWCLLFNNSRSLLSW